MDSRSSRPARPGTSRILKGKAIPADIYSAWEASGHDHADLLAALPSDLARDGSFQDGWLLVGRKGLAATTGAPLRIITDEPFKGITGIDYRKLVGGGIVLVKRGDRQSQLVRCSRATDRAIQAALSKLRVHLALDKQPDKNKPGDDTSSKNKKDTEPAVEGLPELSAKQVAAFLEQIDDLDEQRYCRTCHLPLKKESSVCPVCVNRGKTLRRIFTFAKDYRRQLYLLFVLMLFTVLFRVVPPYIQGQIFDVSLVPKNPKPVNYRLAYLLWSVLALFLSHVMAAGLRIVSGRIAVVAAGAISRDVRGDVFRHLQFLSLSYFDRHKTGALMSRVSRDTQMLQGFLVNGVQFTLVALLEVGLITIVLLWLNWRLALLVLIPTPIVLLFTKLVWSKIMRRFRRLWEAMSRLSAVLNDSLRGVRVVKAFGGEDQEIRRFEDRSHVYFTTEVSAEKTWITLVPLINLIMGLGLYFVLIAGGVGLIRESTLFGPLTPGLVVKFIMYLPMLYMPLQVMTRLNEWLTRSMTAAERIFEILDTEPDIAEPVDPVPMPSIKGGIELREVSFGYEKHTPVVKQMSIKIEPGEMIGLVGHSGAGKSTTINLATRLYDADEGQILIDGVDIRRIPLKDLRSQIGVVLQETFLFSGTVSENIAYAKPGARHEEILAAAKMANAHDFIMKRADGYDSEVEESGGNFSSGEKQRLAIARAILHNPRILILDEATSSVDTKTEKQIQEAITRLTQGRTTIAIAHRLSTLRGASRLAVIDKGKIKELGSHEELVKEEGIYHDLVKTQTEMTSVIAIGG